jgi:hypothetical protein
MAFVTTAPVRDIPLVNPLAMTYLVKTWRTTLVVFYVLFLGAILPFVCWGAWAEPGHAHAGPHFVFATPRPAEHVLPGHDAHHAPESADSVAGQARPSSTLVIASLLLLLGAVPPLLRPVVTRARLHTPLGPRTHHPRIPTPPPRRSMEFASQLTQL